MRVLKKVMQYLRTCHVKRVQSFRDEKYHASKGTKGTEYTIKFFNGKKITTTDLWLCGKIPEEFKDELCNNAEFCKKGE